MIPRGLDEGVKALRSGVRRSSPAATIGSFPSSRKDGETAPAQHSLLQAEKRSGDQGQHAACYVQ